MKKLLKISVSLVGLYVLCFAGLLVGQIVVGDKFPFNGVADNGRDDLDYYYIITGGKFPTGTLPNGDNASGGTFRFLADDPDWGYSIDQWNKDDWFPQNAGFALTIKSGNAILYDNNGIEDGSYGSYYDGPAQGNPYYGLYRGYSSANNWDWIYASYFKLTSPTTFDTLIGYFDGTGYYGNFDPNSPEIGYRMNMWSATGNYPVYMPVNTGGFTGDVFTSDGTPGRFSVSYTGVDRIMPNTSHDPIWRLVFHLAQPVTLPAGVYFFSHDAVIVTANSLYEDAMDQLEMFLGAALTNDQRNKLEETIKHLGNALDPDLWDGDTRVQPKHGEKAFTAAKETVKKLLELIKDKNCALSDIALMGIIDRIMKADQLLAAAAIQDAESAGGDDKEIAKAEEELAFAIDAVNDGKYSEAIDHFKKAWEHAQHAMKKIVE